MVARYYKELLNFCTRQLRDRDAAADLVQDSYVRLLSAEREGRAASEPRALLHQIARRLVIDRHRRAALRDHEDIDALQEPEQPRAPTHQQPEQVLAQMQSVRAYVAAIDTLPPRCREAFVLHVFDGLAHAQVAARMGISVSMVEKHIARGMLACRRCERALEGAGNDGRDKEAGDDGQG